MARIVKFTDLGGKSHYLECNPGQTVRQVGISAGIVPRGSASFLDKNGKDVSDEDVSRVSDPIRLVLGSGTGEASSGSKTRFTGQGSVSGPASSNRDQGIKWSDQKNEARTSSPPVRPTSRTGAGSGVRSVGNSNTSQPPVRSMSSETGPNQGSGGSKGAIIGIIVGILAVVCVLGACIIVFMSVDLGGSDGSEDFGDLVIEDFSYNVVASPTSYSHINLDITVWNKGTTTVMGRTAIFRLSYNPDSQTTMSDSLIINNEIQPAAKQMIFFSPNQFIPASLYGETVTFTLELEYQNEISSRRVTDIKIETGHS